MIDHDGDQVSQSASNANSCGPSGVVRLADLIRVARGVAVVGRHGGWDEKSASTIHTGIMRMVRKGRRIKRKILMAEFGCAFAVTSARRFSI